MDTTSTTTRTMTIRLAEDGIVHVKILPDAEMTLADAKAGNELAWELSMGKRRPRFCDYTEIRSQDSECRAYYASRETAATCLACAILIGSPVSRVIGNFYLGLNRPFTPTRLFTSTDDALEWLRGFPDE
jgi:hypothetical protein